MIETLLNDIRRCQICRPYLPLGVNPVLQAAKNSKILIIGQAPGIKVHQSGIPWDDQSGDRLRQWLDLSKEDFYDPENVAIVPMGFCYPGKGKSGDLPPRPECAVTWHDKLLVQLKNVQLTLTIGKYAQDYILKDRQRNTLTETVRHWQNYIEDAILPLPHPSPRNNIWLRKNPWFENEVLPELQKKIGQALAA